MNTPCPGCGATLNHSGEVTIDGIAKPLPVFQCDHCVRPFEFDGQSFDAALTFALDPHGRHLDVEKLEPLDL